MKQLWTKYPGAAVWVTAWVVLSMHLTTTPGVIAAIAGAVAGLIAPGFLAKRRLREAAIAGAAALLTILNWELTEFLRHSTSTPYAILEILLWSGTALGITCLLEVLRRRFPAMIVLEVLFTGSTFGAILAAHRDGAQHRPYFLVDPLLTRGEDPVLALILAGIIIALCAVTWIFSQTSGRKRTRDLVALLVLLTAALLLLPGSATKLVLHVAASGPGGNKGKSDSKNQDPDPDNNSSKGDPKPVAIVTFHDDYTPPGGGYYFRQTVLSAYRNNRIEPDPTNQFDNDIADGFPTSETRVHNVPPSDGSQLVHTSVALLGPHSRPFGLVAPMSFGPAPNPDPQRFTRAYTVDSLGPARPITELLKLPVGTPGGEAAERYYLATTDDPRFAGIVDEAVASLNPQFRNVPLYRAVAVKLWMDEHVTYNLAAKHDTAADFLFGDRNGFCVHFAQAAVILYRTAGVPARIAQGYMVPSRQRGHGSSLMIRDTDAHAWAEVFIAGAGWTVLDISAKRTVSQEPPPPDLDQQRTLGQLARNLNRKDPPDSHDPSSKGQKPFSQLSDAARSLALQSIAAGLLLTMLALYAGKLWRRIAVRVCRPPALPRIAFRAALDRLADAGLLRPTAQTREQFSAAIGTTTPSLAPLTQIHIQSAFSARVAPARARTEYLALLRNLSRELRQTRPAWRLAIGYLDPWSWTRVK